MKRRTICGLIVLLLNVRVFVPDVLAYYDPTIQRWINRDPADDWGSNVNRFMNVRQSEIDINLSRFAANSPVLYVDDFGLKWTATGKPPKDTSTIVCDGQGGLKVILSKGHQCDCQPARKCVIEHEASHIEDVVKENPDICKGKKEGTWIQTGSTKQLNASEVKAYNREIDCIKKNAVDFKKQCNQSAEDYIKLLEQQRKNYE